MTTKNQCRSSFCHKYDVAFDEKPSTTKCNTQVTMANNGPKIKNGIE
jgi:hypothetical protein